MAESGIRILLVEDNPADVVLVRELLREVNIPRCELVTTDRLQRALDLADREQPDVILLDLGLPDSHGLETLERMRAQVSGTPIIVLTHSNDVDTAVDAARGGAHDYLVKGEVSPSLLFRSIRYALERWRSQQALRVSEHLLQESEDRLRLAIDSTELGVFDFHPQNGRLIWSEFAKRHFGVRSNVDVTYQLFLQGLHPDDRARVDRIVRETLNGTGTGQYSTEYRTIGIEDGKERHLAAWGRAYFNPDGQAIRFVGITLDVTARKRAEAALREADQRKDEFLATLAHELRNPLAPIRFALTLLDGQQRDATAERAVKVIDRQVGHFSRLIDDLLDVSRITRNKIHLRSQRVALADVLNAALDLMRPLAKASKHVVDVAPVPAVWIEVDPDRLVQVFSNIFNNAIKFTPPGGRISVDVEAHADTVIVRVADTGVGFPKESHSRIFDMFYQEESTLERTSSGLGIGLTLAKALVEMHGGTIEAESEGHGLGAKFAVTLRRATPAAIADAAAVAQEARPEERALRVLIVDDNSDAADMLQIFVSAMGHDTSIAYDGPSAVSRAEAFRPDLMLLDVGLPGMNGYEVARSIRQQADLSGVYIAAVTGWGQDEDRRRARDAGFDSHLTKPVNPEVLKHLLGELSHTLTCPGCERCLKVSRTRAGDSHRR